MTPRPNTPNDELKKETIELLKETGTTDLRTLIERTNIEDREAAKSVMRSLIDEGKVGTTPNWEYKLASRLRN